MASLDIDLIREEFETVLDLVGVEGALYLKDQIRNKRIDGNNIWPQEPGGECCILGTLAVWEQEKDGNQAWTISDRVDAFRHVCLRRIDGLYLTDEGWLDLEEWVKYVEPGDGIEDSGVLSCFDTWINLWLEKQPDYMEKFMHRAGEPVLPGFESFAS